MPYALRGCVVHGVVPCLYAGLYAACTHHSQASPGCCTLGCARVSGDTTELGWAPRAGRRLGRAARAAQRQPRLEAAQRQDRGSLEAAQRQARAQSRGNPEQPRGRPEAAQSGPEATQRQARGSPEHGARSWARPGRCGSFAFPNNISNGYHYYFLGGLYLKVGDFLFGLR